MELFWTMKTPVMSEFKQQGCSKGFVSLGRWWPQQECQKSSKFILAKEELCTCSILLGTFFSFSTKVMGSLSKEDGDSNEKGKEAIGLISKTTTLHMHQAFCTFHCRHCRTTKWKRLISRFLNSRQRLSFSFPVLRIQRQKHMPTFDELHKME